LLWFQPLEYAFNNSHICYLFEPQSETFQMRILDSRLRGFTFREYIKCENDMDSTILLRTREQWLSKFSKNPNDTQEGIKEKMIAVDNLLSLLDSPIVEFEGKALMNTEEKCYSRCLSFQAAMTRQLTIENGWIEKDEVTSPDMFSELEEKKKSQLLSWFKTMEPASIPYDDI